MVRIICSSVVLLVSLSIVGCGGAPSDMPELGTVTGVVTLGGQPLANANIEFRPAEGRPSSAVTGADGSYALLYTAEYDGAKVGEHSVVVSIPTKEGDYDTDENDPKGNGLPYTASDGSIKKTVNSGSNEINIEL